MKASSFEVEVKTSELRPVECEVEVKAPEVHPLECEVEMKAPSFEVKELSCDQWSVRWR